MYPLQIFPRCISKSIHWNISHFLYLTHLLRPNTWNSDYCTCRGKNVLNAKVVERKTCCYVANAFLSKLELIWLISKLKISKNVLTFHCPIFTPFWQQQFHRRFMRHSLLRTLLQPGVSILYPCFPIGHSGNSSFGFHNMFLFPGAGYRPAAQPPAWRTSGCSSSGLYPSTNLAWLDLPGTKVPAGTALWVIESHELHHHNKVSAQGEWMCSCQKAPGVNGLKITIEHMKDITITLREILTCLHHWISIDPGLVQFGMEGH